MPSFASFRHRSVTQCLSREAISTLRPTPWRSLFCYCHFNWHFGLDGESFTHGLVCESEQDLLSKSFVLDTNSELLVTTGVMSSNHLPVDEHSSSNGQSGKNRIDELSSELHQHIGQHLSPRDLDKVVTVSRNLHRHYKAVVQHPARLLHPKYTRTLLHFIEKEENVLRHLTDGHYLRDAIVMTMARTRRTHLMTTINETYKFHHFVNSLKALSKFVISTVTSISAHLSCEGFPKIGGCYLPMTPKTSQNNNLRLLSLSLLLTSLLPLNTNTLRVNCTSLFRPSKPVSSFGSN